MNKNFAKIAQYEENTNNKWQENDGNNYEKDCTNN